MTNSKTVRKMVAYQLMFIFVVFSILIGVPLLVTRLVLSIPVFIGTFFNGLETRVRNLSVKIHRATIKPVLEEAERLLK